jgi:hypothetical protein
MLGYYLVFCFICFAGMMTEQIVNDWKNTNGYVFFLYLVCALTPVFNLWFFIRSMRTLYVTGIPREEVE